ncbi:MAG: glycosyltransferase [Steroidobacteraceae bacterium]
MNSRNLPLVTNVSCFAEYKNRHVAKVLDGIDALVVPSLWHENMALVTLSARAAACPIIASDIGGLSDVVVHDKNGAVLAGIVFGAGRAKA